MSDPEESSRPAAGAQRAGADPGAGEAWAGADPGAGEASAGANRGPGGEWPGANPRAGRERAAANPPAAADPVGVILAGGAGARIGGTKATVELHGKPLICYPLEALQGALAEVVVIAKSDTKLPSLPGVTVWIEPPSDPHPLVGLVQAIGLADGRAVLICAADLPFVTAEVVRALATAELGGAPAVIAASAGRIQPLLGRYEPNVPELLGRAAAGARDVRVQEAIAALGPRLLELEDPDVLFNVNTPDDLLQAAAMLDRRRYPKVKS